MEDLMKHRAAVQENIEKAFNGGVNLNEELKKARSGVYADTAENRKLGRVGQQYGNKKQEDKKTEKKEKNEYASMGFYDIVFNYEEAKKHGLKDELKKIIPVYNKRLQDIKTYVEHKINRVKFTSEDKSTRRKNGIYYNFYVDLGINKNFDVKCYNLVVCKVRDGKPTYNFDFVK